MVSYICSIAAAFALVVIAPGASASSNCLNFNLSDVFNISSCLGGPVNLCSSSSITTSLSKLLSCFIPAIFSAGTPQGIFNALGPFFAVIASRLIPFGNLISLGNLSLCGSQNCSSFFRTNATCGSAISLQIPRTGNFNACVSDLTICSVGSMATPQSVDGFVTVISCLLGQLSFTNFLSATTGILCPFLQGLSGISGSLTGPLTSLLSIFIPLVSLFAPSCSTSG
ncbi:hypothetical protein V5799_021790 [Amblyomma americanum]|uniref:Secreted protein n=1 Tax=Amblyomma americanum TaxID=6943 RepID=A0AAQ4FMD2_AMBAM